MKVAFVIFLIIALMLGGCAHAPYYTLDVMSQQEPPKHALRIAVAPFVDERSSKKPNIRGKAFSAMMVTHFENAKLFTQQKVVGNDFIRPTSEQLFHLKTKGYDAILIGSITDFSWSRETPSSSALLPIWIAGFAMPIFWLFLIPGSLLISQGKVVMEHTGLTAKLIETSSGNVIWEGQASGSATIQDLPEEVSVIDASLKIAVTSLIEQLKSASFQPK